MKTSAHFPEVLDEQVGDLVADCFGKLAKIIFHPAKGFLAAWLSGKSFVYKEMRV